MIAGYNHARHEKSGKTLQKSIKNMEFRVSRACARVRKVI
jgi:hypothetical protein